MPDRYHSRSKTIRCLAYVSEASKSLLCILLVVHGLPQVSSASIGPPHRRTCLPPLRSPFWCTKSCTDSRCNTLVRSFTWPTYQSRPFRSAISITVWQCIRSTRDVTSAELFSIFRRRPSQSSSLHQIIFWTVR